MGTRHRRRHARQVRRERPAHFACGVDAFENFDLVASGARDIGRPRGAALVRRAGVRDDPGDLRPAGTTSRPGAQSPCRRLHRPHRSGTKRAIRTGFVGTNTQLTEDNHRWGANGGFLRMAARRLQRRHAHRSRGTLLRSHGGRQATESRHAHGGLHGANVGPARKRISSRRTRAPRRPW